MTEKLTIYHNPRCSKSRQALSILEEQGVEPVVVEYLNQPLTADELRRLIKLLDVPAHEILRTKEPEYREAGLSPSSSEDEIVAAIVQYPKLLERPIVVRGDRAVIGRPPENIRELF